MEWDINSPCVFVNENKITGLSDFDVLAHIWDVGSNVKEKR